MVLNLNTSFLAGGVVLLLCVYKYLIHPLFISPLSQIPNAHPLAGWTSFWILLIRYRGCELQTIHKAHQRLGAIIRLGPNEISVNCVKGGIQTIYSGGFEKGTWYNFFVNYGCVNDFSCYFASTGLTLIRGVINMFSDPHSKSHSARKRMISNVYSKSCLQNSPTMTEVTKELLFRRILPKLDTYASQSKILNIYPELSGMTMDFVTGYQFGLAASSNLIQDEAFRNQFLDLYYSRHAHNFFPQEMPKFTSFLSSIGYRIVPEWVDTANMEIENWVMKMCDGASSFLTTTKATSLDDLAAEDAQNFPAVYSQLVSGIEKSKIDSLSTSPEQERLDIASELLDHLAAGFDTSGITLVYVIHELSQNLDIQTALRKELRTLDPPITVANARGTSPILVSPKLVEALPLLDAIIQETLRLHAAIPGPEPRVTPLSGCTLGPEGEYKGIPGGVRISAQAWSLHRNSEVYERPDVWLPARWLHSDTETTKEMKRWFWAFGSGGRMCVGSNLALYRECLVDERCSRTVLTSWNRNEVYCRGNIHKLQNNNCG
jgi:cytochrome P450